MPAVSERERQKYADIWQLPAYSDMSPGAQTVDAFVQIAKPWARARILDVGAGKGAGTEALVARGFRAEGFDIAEIECRPVGIPFHIGSVWRDLPLSDPYDFTYCCDMMEHIPTEFTALTVSNILRTAPKAFFSISFNQDAFGAFLRTPLHLTVKPFVWWRDLMLEVGDLLDARDLLGDGFFYVARKHT